MYASINVKCYLKYIFTLLFKVLIIDLVLHGKIFLISKFVTLECAQDLHHQAQAS